MTVPVEDASAKLRAVLDYLPCEACLAQPTRDQEVLCSICHRLHRQVAVRVSTRTTILLERPSTPDAAAVAPVLIPPAGPAATEAPAPAHAEGPMVGRDVVVEPYEEGAPAEAAAVAPPAPKKGFFRRKPKEAPAPLAPPAEAPAPAEEEPAFDDVVDYTGPTDDGFDYVRDAPEPTQAEAALAPEESAFDYTPGRREPEPVAAPVEAPPQDDFVFRPPAQEEAAAAQPEPVEDFLPTEEIPVEPERPEENPWAPPPEADDFLQEPASLEPAALPQEHVEAIPQEEAPYQPAAQDETPPQREHEPEEPAEEDVILETIVDEEPVETTVVEEEIVEMEIIPDDEPTPTPPPAAPSPVAAPAAEPPEPRPEELEAPPHGSDLHHLRGFTHDHADKLGPLGITSLSHLSGHDPHDLAARAQIPPETLSAWIHVANLHHEIGIPVDPALALVQAGIQGPRGLRETDATEIVDRVAAYTTSTVSERDVKRWKRRA